MYMPLSFRLAMMIGQSFLMNELFFHSFWAFSIKLFTVINFQNFVNVIDHFQPNLTFELTLREELREGLPKLG